LGCPRRSVFAQLKSLISLGARFFLDEYRAVFAVNVTSPLKPMAQGEIEIARALLSS
jgi:hypothetical protein